MYLVVYHTLTLSPDQTLTLLPCNLVNQSNCHPTVLLQYHPVTFPDPHIVTHIAILSLQHSVTASHCHAVVFLPGSLSDSVFQSIEEFLCSVEAAAEECGILLKKGDKKKEKYVYIQ